MMINMKQVLSFYLIIFYVKTLMIYYSDATSIDGGEVWGSKSCKTEIENGSNFDDFLLAIMENPNQTPSL